MKKRVYDVKMSSYVLMEDCPELHCQKCGAEFDVYERGGGVCYDCFMKSIDEKVGMKNE